MPFFLPETTIEVQKTDRFTVGRYALMDESLC